MNTLEPINEVLEQNTFVFYKFTFFNGTPPALNLTFSEHAYNNKEHEAYVEKYTKNGFWFELRKKTNTTLKTKIIIRDVDGSIESEELTTIVSRRTERIL